jgi:hypothetical protein
MLRRTTIGLALAGLAIAAPSAFANSHWNSQMKSATATASRSAGGCTITPHSRGVLGVSCSGGDEATLTYAFPLKKGITIKGTPWCDVKWMGYADVHNRCSVVSQTLRVTVTVADGYASLSTVNVGYYT